MSARATLMNEPRRFFFDKSRQLWKLRFTVLWCPIAFVLLGVATTSGLLSSLEGRVGVLTAVSDFLLLGLSLWGVITIRCPSCKTRIVWKAIREKNPGDCWPWLTSLARCPVCGSEGDVRQMWTEQPSVGQLNAPKLGTLVSAGCGFISAVLVAVSVRLLVFQFEGGRTNPPAHALQPMILELLAWALGAMAGGFVAGRLGAQKGHAAPLTVGVLVLFAAVALWRSNPMPIWFWVSWFVAALPSASLGGMLAARRRNLG